MTPYRPGQEAPDPLRTTLRVWFAGQERTFRLRMGELEELESLCGFFGAILGRLASQTYGVRDIWEPIRLALQGGGMPEARATALCRAYQPPNYELQEFYPLAVQVVNAVMAGVPPPKPEGERTGNHESPSGPETSPLSTG